MKNKGKFLFSILLLVIMVFANSCSFEMNKRRYNRGWDFGYSSKYGSVESPKKTKLKNVEDTSTFVRVVEEQITLLEIETQNENAYVISEIENLRFSNDTLDSLNQTDSTLITVIDSEDEIFSDSEEEVKKAEVESSRKKDYVYLVAMVFLSILGFLALFYYPYLLIFLVEYAFWGSFNIKLLIILSSIFLGGKILTTLMLFRAGTNLKKEKYYSDYKSKYDSLVSLSYLALGIFTTLLFVSIFKRYKSEFPEENSSTKKNIIIEGLKVILGLLLALFLLIIIGDFFF